MSNAGGVSSSPPVEKMIKASPTLFEMMSHEQQQEPGQQQQQEPKLLQNTISLSQQLTFQEKMKTILAGIASYYSPLSHYFLLLSKEKKKKERTFLPSFLPSFLHLENQPPKSSILSSQVLFPGAT
jgi:hypothetical protein